MPKCGPHLKNLKRKYEWLDFRRSYAETNFEKNLVKYSHNCNIVVVRKILRQNGTPVAFGTVIGVGEFQIGSNLNPTIVIALLVLASIKSEELTSD